VTDSTYKFCLSGRREPA